MESKPDFGLVEKIAESLFFPDSYSPSSVEAEVMQRDLGFPYGDALPVQLPSLPSSFLSRNWLIIPGGSVVTKKLIKTNFKAISDFFATQLCNERLGLL